MHRHARLAASVLAALAGLPLVAALPATAGTGTPALTTATATTERSARAALAEVAGPGTRTSVLAGTDRLRFFAASPGHAVPGTVTGAKAGATPEQAARAFLARFGAAFGVARAADDLRTTKAVTGAGGATTVRFQQVSRGVPVFGGELAVRVERSGAVTSVNGRTSTGPTTTAPTRSAAQAATAARRAVAKANDLKAADVVVDAPELVAYDPAMLGWPGPAGVHLVWRTEGRTADRSVRELVLVDATTGAIALRYSENEHAKQRMVCNFGNVVKADPACNAPYARTEGQGATGVKDVDKAYDYAGITYDFFASKFGRDSLDGKGMPLKSTVKYCPDSSSCPLQNAFWDGRQMAYGDTYASADDVVGHELSHGVTDFTSSLFYYYQSGAINESMSDVFGELIDLSDGVGTDTAAVRWDIGEDLPIGAIRNMMRPQDFSNPDRMTSPYYWSGDDDAGGVHTNSGVNNKAAALMVDGGTFNGQTVTALGVDTVARVYYEAGTTMMLSATDYRDLFDILPQACQNLVGSNGITAADCTSVRKAVLATEMDVQNDYAPVPEAPICPAGQQRSDVVADDLEDPTTNRWVTKATTGFGWAYPQGENAYPGYDPQYATSGTTSMWGDDPDSASDASIGLRTGFAVPAGRKSYLRFAHSFGFESGFFSSYDGGTVEYSTDNGATWVNAAALPADNGFNATVSALGGAQGYGGVSQGYLTSRFDLSSLAGRTVKVRFRVASDSSVGSYGWFVDDVQVYSCGAAPASIRVADARVVEPGAGGAARLDFTVTRSSGTGSASVRWATDGGTATAGSDVVAASGTASFAPGVTSVTVPVTVTGDAVPETDETVGLTLSSPVDAVLADSSAVGTVTDDDAGTPASLSVDDAVVTEGSTGTRNAVLTLRRSGSTAEAVTVSVRTANGTAGASDFTALAPRTVTIPAGATSATVSVPVAGDTVDESNETFSLVLSAPTRAVLADDTAVATIVDDEGAVVPGPKTWFSVGDVRVVEGAGSTAAVVTVSRSGVTTGTGSVTLRTGSGTATAAADYTALGATVVSFAAGQTSRTVTVPVLADAVPEWTETVPVTATAATGGALADAAGVVRIADTDTGTPASVSVDDVAVVEQGSGTVTATFTVRRTGSTAEPVRLTWATGRAPAGVAATAGDDYAPRGATSLTIAAGATTGTATVTVVPDSDFEANEVFAVDLSAVSRAGVADGQAIGTVLDDD